MRIFDTKTEFINKQKVKVENRDGSWQCVHRTRGFFVAVTEPLLIWRHDCQPPDSEIERHMVQLLILTQSYSNEHISSLKKYPDKYSFKYVNKCVLL